MSKKINHATRKSNTHSESILVVILTAALFAFFSLLQNSFGRFSDILGYYGMRFADGQHEWPFTTYTLLGANEPTVPVQYPALIGLIMWIFSFFVTPSESAGIEYFRTTATAHIFIYSFVAFCLVKLSERRVALFFILSPAVLYSLNRNWDIWAILPMLGALLYFQKGKFRTSSVLLALSIATKFFPIVILVPASIYFIRKRQLRSMFRFVFETLIYWLIINFPFMLINFRGWLAFYEFNLEREVGSASIFEITTILNIPLPSSDMALYLLNIFSLTLVVFYLIKYKSTDFILEGSFFIMFAFMLFNKQYSMQYIIWLTSLGVLALYKAHNKNRVSLVIFFVVWQISELLFQYAFMQRILTVTFRNTQVLVTPEVSENLYALTGLVRYLLAIGFAVTLAIILNNQRSREVEAQSARSAKR